MKRAKQTFDEEYYMLGGLLARNNHQKIKKMDKRYGIKLAIILFALLMLVIAVIGWWRARTQGIPVSIWSVVKWYQAVFIPFIFPLVAMAAIAVISCWVLPWLVRPWMITHVRRAICDLGYAEVCRRCGYLLSGLPRGRVQCPECGAIRDRPRSIPKRDMTVHRFLDE